MSSVQDMRQFMTKLAKIAEKYNCAIVLVAHMPKSTAKGAANPLGSVDIKAAASIIEHLSRHKIAHL
jgi:RecA-family ATPase